MTIAVLMKCRAKDTTAIKDTETLIINRSYVTMF